MHDACVRRTTFGLVALALLAAGCGTDDPSVTAAQQGRPVVVTALRPLADVIERVGGDDVVVIDLIPVGSSPHELELTARQREEILGADLAVVLGKGFQRDVEATAALREGDTLAVLDAMGLPDRPDGAEGPLDPHIWLDPTIMGSVVTAVGEAIVAVAPEHASAIRDRAASIVEQNVRLDAQIRQGLTGCERTVIVSQHESFGWFAARYGFTNVGFDGPVPDDDPAPDPAYQERAEQLLTRDVSITTLFLETLAPTSWIEVIAEERGLDVAVLNPYEGLTLRDAANDISYRSVMLANLRVLQERMECES